MQDKIEIDEKFYFVTLANVIRMGYVKHRFAKFRGVAKENFLLYLKENFNIDSHSTKLNNKVYIKSC